MEKKYLIVNIGSVSKRYAVYENNQEILSAYFEKDEMNARDFENAIMQFFNLAKEKGTIESEKNISSIGLRIVASGSCFREDKVIDEEYLTNLKKAKEKAPLHLEPLIKEIEKLKNLLPNIPMVGISDSAFHSTLPKHSYLYSVPQDDAQKADIYRFGYHGISIQSILRKIQKDKGSVPARIIVAHLGGGASITAIKDGKSFDTSMGTTPLEGLTMATRVGNIGAGALIQLAKEKEMNLDELNDYFNTKCGLLGLSGSTGNVKELLKLEDDGDKDARLALEIFVYNVKKYIGAYIVGMGGLDMLVLSGTISERSSTMRGRILRGLECVGVEMDKNKNDETLDIEGYIESETSKVKIAVIKINELEEIALRTSELLQ
jgi:acetate kinase